MKMCNFCVLWNALFSNVCWFYWSKKKKSQREFSLLLFSQVITAGLFSMHFSLSWKIASQIFPFFILIVMRLTIPTCNSMQFRFDMEITFWSIDCMKSTVILWRQNPADVAVDAAKTVTLMCLNARIGPLNYPAYAYHTQ